MKYLNKYFNLLIFCILFVSAQGSITDSDVMWYSGSFDPPTLGHVEIIRDIAKKSNGPIYLTVNHNTGKNFNASVRERIKMLKEVFKDHENIHILREPIEGRRAFVNKLSQLHDAKVVMAVGEDVIEKNYKLLGDLENLSFLLYDRPGQETTFVPNGVSPIINEKQPVVGLSSTAVRDLIIKGESPSHLLTPEVDSYIKQHKLYQSLELDKERMLQAFKILIQNNFPSIDQNTFERFDFKGTQSLGGQKDALIRWFLKNANIPDDKKGKYISFLESKLGEKFEPISFVSKEKIFSEEKTIQKIEYYRNKYNINIPFPLTPLSSSDFEDYITFHLAKDKSIKLEDLNISKDRTPLIWDSRKQLMEINKYSKDTSFITICHIQNGHCFYALPENAKYSDGSPVPRELTLYDYKLPGRPEFTPHRQMMEHLGLWSYDKPIWEQNKNYRGGSFKVTDAGIEINTTSGQLNRPYDGYPSKKMNNDDAKLFKKSINRNLKVYCYKRALQDLL